MSRASHVKSRNGCFRCKERRVRCNGRQPCNNCLRRKEICSFDGSAVDHARLLPVDNKAPLLDLLVPRVRTDQMGSQINEMSSEPVQQMLMRHYYSGVYCTVSSRPKTMELWRAYVPSLAQSFPFLSYGLLMFASSHLHMLHLDSPNPTSDTERQIERYELLYSNYQTLALTHFRTAISCINEENSSAVFAMAAVLSVCSAAKMCRPLPSNVVYNGQAALDNVIEIFVLTRGVREVMIPVNDIILKSPMGIMISGHGLLNHLEVELPPLLEARLSNLEVMVHELASIDKLDACLGALTELRRVYKDFAFLQPETKMEMGVLMKWMVMVPPGYVTCLRERNTAALIILAHFVILFTCLRGRWYLRSFAERALRATLHAIPPEAMRWAQWPEEQLKQGLPAFAVDNLLKSQQSHAI